MTNDYPKNYVPQLIFPNFSKDEYKKLNTLFDVSFEEYLVLFFTENAGKVSTKTCLAVYENGEREIQGFISNWVYHTLYDKKEEILSIIYTEDEKELQELH